LQLGIPNYYKFDAKISRYGALEFKYDNKKITYDNMYSVLTNDYIKANEQINKLEKESRQLENELEKLKYISTKKDYEYLMKEKQIATYLECRKTFFGKVKYFFKSKKMKKEQTTDEMIDFEQKVEEEEEISFVQKEFYTIEEVVNIYKDLEIILNKVKNLQMDVNAIKTKIEMVETKIKNANIYIEEIDKHEKSIFEFWKFASKDENLGLNAGTSIENSCKNKIEKVYTYPEDVEEIGVLLDKKQRNVFKDKEMDSIYVASTEILQVLNNIDNNELVINSLEELKKQEENRRKLFSEKKIDIFGKMEEDNTKIKTLSNKKHRETERDKLKILGITKDMSIDDYQTKLEEIIANINNCLENVKETIAIPVYIACEENKKVNGLQVCNLNPSVAIENCTTEEEIALYRIDLEENSKVIYFSNSIYYNNYNKTLPIGMEKDAKCLIDLSTHKLEQVDKNDFRISSRVNEFKVDTKKVVIYEYKFLKEE